MLEIDGNREGGMKRRIFLREKRMHPMTRGSVYGSEREKQMMNVEAEVVESRNRRPCIEEI